MAVKNKLYRDVLLVLLLLLCTGGAVAAQDNSGHLYVTGSVMEIDRCASAWLIKRYVDQDARFMFLTDQELIKTEAQSFDTPFSKLRRTHKYSTFESIVLKYAITDDKVVEVAGLIHEIEINGWNRQKRKAATFEYEMKKIINNSTNNQDALARCWAYLDTLYLNP